MRRKPAETELGRDLQKSMDYASVVANWVVREKTKNILKSKQGEEGKPS